MAIINNSFNFVFVHIPKTAGTTITSILGKYTNYCDLEIGGTEFGEMIQPGYKKRFGLSKHSSARDIRNIVGQVEWTRFFTFSFVRNPFARCLSTYNFLRKWDSPNVEFNARMKSFDTFNEYVLSDVWAKGNGPDDIFRPQANWLRSGPESKQLLVDYVGRVENISNDFAEILSMIGISKAKASVIDMPVLNKSSSDSLSELADPDVIEKIVEQYEIDFEMFGYSTYSNDYLAV